MATVTRAKNFLIYLIALTLSALFSLFGRPAPSWADEVKSDYSARVFEEVFRVAQGTTTQGPIDRRFIDTGTGTTTQGPIDRRFIDTGTPDSRKGPAWFPGGFFFGSISQMPQLNSLQSRMWTTIPNISQENIELLNNRMTIELTAIHDKLLANPNNLTLEELALFRANLNAVLLQQLILQVQILQNTTQQNTGGDQPPQ